MHPDSAKAWEQNHRGFFQKLLSKVLFKVIEKGNKEHAGGLPTFLEPSPACLAWKTSCTSVFKPKAHYVICTLIKCRVETGSLLFGRQNVCVTILS